jgi:hypothetical protein
VRPIFREPEQQALFDARGFIFHDFLTAEQVERLRGLYVATAGALETYDFATRTRSAAEPPTTRSADCSAT